MALMARICIVLLLIAASSATVQAVDQEAIPGGSTKAKDSNTLIMVIDRNIACQAILKDISGTPVPDNTYNLTFRIYRQASGGAALWTSASTTVTTTGGLFSAQLGPISLPFDTTYYISIQVAETLRCHGR